MKRIIVVSPHPDDETLGAGGYLLKEKKAGNQIFWLNVTNVKREYGYSEERCRIRNKELDTVNALFSFDGFYNLELEPAGLDKYEKRYLVQEIGKVFQNVRPNIIIVPNFTDAHSDHKIVFDTVWACTKAFRYPFIESIMCMQIISETDYSIPDEGFVPNYFVNIEAELEQKINILNVYKSEMMDMPFPRNSEVVKALAIVNGATSFCRAAEAFRIIKMIVGSEKVC